MSDWKTITIPKTCYLPVGDANSAFKDSGLRVEPTDKVELLTGSTQIRINGATHHLMRNIDHLIDPNGVLQLAKPAPPVKISAGGAGWGVGRMGEVTSRLRGSWDHEAAEEWQGDGATIAHPGMFSDPEGGTDLFGRPDQHRGFKVVREDAGAHDTPFGKTAKQVSFGGGPDRNWTPDERAAIDEFFGELGEHMREDWVEEREVTLRDGSKARALFDKRTGKQIGTPQRMYQVRRDAQGRQLAAPTSSHGPNARFDMDEYRRRMAAQMADSTPAPTFREAQAVHEAKNKGTRIPDPALDNPLDHPIEAVPAPSPHVETTSTGSPHLDSLLDKVASTPGWPLRTVSTLNGPPEATESLLRAAGASFADSIQAAFGHIHLLKPGQTPLIAIHMPPDLTDALRLDIAEQLPTLAEMLVAHKVAVVLALPDWTDAHTPALLRYLPKIKVQVAPHESDPRFLTAKTASGESISFPRPQPNP